MYRLYRFHYLFTVVCHLSQVDGWYLEYSYVVDLSLALFVYDDFQFRCVLHWTLHLTFLQDVSSKHVFSQIIIFFIYICIFA